MTDTPVVDVVTGKDVAERLHKLADDFASGKFHIATFAQETHLEEVPTAPDEDEAWRVTGTQSVCLVFADSPELAEVYRAAGVTS